MLPAWVADYIGLPFVEHGRDRDGLDCYGLLYLVHLEVYGNRLPSYVEGYRTLRDVTDIAAMLSNAAASPEWRQVAEADTHPIDTIIFRIYGQPFHVGLVVGPGDFLNVRRGINACVERWDGSAWRNRIVGFYRHVNLDGARA